MNEIKNEKIEKIREQNRNRIKKYRLRIRNTEKRLDTMIENKAFFRLEKLAEFSGKTKKEFIENLVNKHFFDFLLENDQFRAVMAKEDIRLFLDKPEI